MRPMVTFMMASSRGILQTVGSRFAIFEIIGGYRVDISWYYLSGLCGTM
jgi:hypothetical protein